MGESTGVEEGKMEVEEVSFEDKCNNFRNRIKQIGDEIKTLMGSYFLERDQDYPEQHGEIKANIMLAYRYLEDARMRIGKILQAADDGVSILDK